ncbi:MAG: glycosyltransferase family 2 protein, partial [Lachnospiraceae bacterium]|nr:glycosyltransferase family 2 protein [Lachnospiraceae bacterium]
MDHKNMISIIVPMYNSEKVIRRSLDSILEQTYRDYEVVMIDDGSKDGTAGICAEYVSRDPERFKYYYQVNAGVSAARNAGIRNSNGKYLAFLDADDKMAANMLELMADAAEKYSAQMVMCSYFKEKNGKTEEVYFNCPEGLYEGGKEKELFFYLINMNSKKSRPYSGIRMVLRSFLLENDIWFDEKLPRSEDFLFWVKVHYKLNMVYYLSKTPLYYYIVNDKSITHNHVENYWDISWYIYRDLKQSIPDSEGESVGSALVNMLYNKSFIGF